MSCGLSENQNDKDQIDNRMQLRNNFLQEFRNNGKIRNRIFKTGVIIAFYSNRPRGNKAVYQVSSGRRDYR